MITENKEKSLADLACDSLDAQRQLAEAMHRVEKAKLLFDAELQRRDIESRLKKMDSVDRIPESFDPEEFDALSEREIRHIVTGE
jgi:hypothetical protein